MKATMFQTNNDVKLDLEQYRNFVRETLSTELKAYNEIGMESIMSMYAQHIDSLTKTYREKTSYYWGIENSTKSNVSSLNQQYKQFFADQSSYTLEELLTLRNLLKSVFFEVRNRLMNSREYGQYVLDRCAPLHDQFINNSHKLEQARPKEQKEAYRTENASSSFNQKI